MGNVLRNTIKSSLEGMALGDLLGGLCKRNNHSRLLKGVRTVLDQLARKEALSHIADAQISDDTILVLTALRSVQQMGFVCRADLETRYRQIETRGGHQIYKLRASHSVCHVASDGLTNGAVLRGVVLSYLYGSQLMGDIFFDVLKIGTLTHGHPNALTASMFLAATTAFAVEGTDRDTIKSLLGELASPILRICNGGDLVFENLDYALSTIEGKDVVDAIDRLERSIGFSVSASSSIVSALAIALNFPDANQVLPILLQRNRAGWDLDSTAAAYGTVAGAFKPVLGTRAVLAKVEEDIGSRFDDLAGTILGQRHCIYNRFPK